MTKRDLVVKIAKETDLIQNDVAQVVQKPNWSLAALSNCVTSVFLKSKSARAARAATPTSPKTKWSFPNGQWSSSVPVKS